MSAEWEGKTRGGAAGYRAFIFLLKHFGLKSAYGLLLLVAPYFVLFVPKARKPMVFYFRHILRFSRAKSFWYLFKNNFVFGQVLIDKVALMSGVSTKFTFNFEGEENLHQMASENGGFIIGAHMGNWEIAGQLLHRINTKVHIVMLESEHEKIKTMLDEVMTQKSMHIIPIKEDLSHLFAIREALEKNELIAIHGDRFLPGSKTITANFMGYDADFPAGPFSLAIKYNKPITYISAIRHPKMHYHFFATRPKTYASKRSEFDQSLKSALSDYISFLSKTILQHPEQWFNYYYFWK
ncbi:MAG: acyltransferase [Bacteroidales bacterium]|jgi:predicted LPLAT superfamily acyltransferase